MPLSEDEQRILRQIEQELESDPAFSERGYRVSRRRLVLLAAGLAAGLVLTVAGLAISFWLAFVGFVAVLFMAVKLEAEIRAQFEAFQKTGLRLDHVNAHNHMHLHPPVLGLLLRIGREYGLDAIMCKCFILLHKGS